MDAHHVLLLGLDQPLLHLPPRHAVQLAVRDPQGRVVEALDVPELEHVVDDDDKAGHPEEHRDEDKGLCEEVHGGEGGGRDDVSQGQLVRLTIGNLVLEKDRIVDALGHEHGEEDDEDELGKLEDLLQHHDGEAVLLVIVVNFGEE